MTDTDNSSSDPCPECAGRGWKETSLMYPGQDLTETCSYCDGTGKNLKFEVSLGTIRADLWKANIRSSDDALDVLDKYASASMNFTNHRSIRCDNDQPGRHNNGT